MKKLLTLLLVCITFILPRAPRPTKFATIKGHLFTLSNQTFQNTLIFINKRPYKMLHKGEKYFEFENIPTGKIRFEYYIQDPILGNFKSIPTNFILTNNQIIALNLSPQKNEKVKNDPITANQDFNKKIVISGFLQNQFTLAPPPLKRKFFSKTTWQENIQMVIETLLDEYKNNQGLDKLILITGHTSINETPNKTESHQLAINRATFIYQFIIDNFRINPEIFIISSKADKDPQTKKENKRQNNQRVEIKFYSQNFIE